MDHREIQELIDRISHLEAKQAELASLFDLINEKSEVMSKELADEIERLRKLREQS